MEITISDSRIPAVPPGDDSDDARKRPYSCDIRVVLNDEPSLRASVYPSGEEEPYSVTSGFRFPVPIGVTALKFSYRSCRVEDTEVVSIELLTNLVVEEGQTHEIVFDGAELSVLDPQPNEVVTLEDIYEAITGARSPVE